MSTVPLSQGVGKRMRIHVRQPILNDETAYLAAAVSSKALHRPWVLAPSTPERFCQYVQSMSPPTPSHWRSRVGFSNLAACSASTLTTTIHVAQLRRSRRSVPNSCSVEPVARLNRRTAPTLH